MSIKKVLRYGLIYGFHRTVIKVAGRSRKSYLRFFFGKLFFFKTQDTSLIGCGQFGFSTISYFILKRSGNRFLECFDINKVNEISTANFWGYRSQPNVLKLINNPDCKYVYIASNHASHTDYAVQALNAGKVVYVEKPVSVSYPQFIMLFGLCRQMNNKDRLFVGYNRPFSQAVRTLSNFIKNTNLPITLNCFVIGHFIGPDHWYRLPEEGTRICGNVGHWIDLSIHLLNTRGQISEDYDISISYSNEEDIDDNISISMVTNNHDLINILISSRAEPFEGINESIQFQSGEVIAKIDDFRRMHIWHGNEKYSYAYKPKDVGHSVSISQPYRTNIRRNFAEIEVSTVIMLEVTDMVKKRESNRKIRPFEIIRHLLEEKNS